MSKRTAQIANRQRLLDSFFKVDGLTIEMTNHDGAPMELKRLVFERGHAAAVLPYDPANDSVVLISEMRPGILSAGDDPFSLSIVAGMIDPGENGLQTVFREAVEESGLKIGKAYLIHPGLYVSPGGTSEKIALYCGIVDSTQVKEFAGKPEEGEDIQTHVMPFGEFIRRIDAHEINDMKTVVTGYWLQRDTEGLRNNPSKTPKPMLEPSNL